MRKQKTTVTNKNYTGIKNSTPRELIAGIMTFTNKEGEVFYGGEVPFFIMDTDDVWLSYSIRNPDDTETKGHFSSIKNSDMRPETNIHSSSPTKYVH